MYIGERKQTQVSNPVISKILYKNTTSFQLGFEAID